MYKFLLRHPRNILRPIRCDCFSTTNDPGGSNNKTKPNPSKLAANKTVTNESLQWRTPWHQKEGNYFSFLRTLYDDDNQLRVMKLLHSPINLSPSAILEWWRKKKQDEEILLQSYLPERQNKLGNELAAAHFIVYRGGAVKFFNEDRWIKANKFNEYDLPRFYEQDKFLEAIDCTDMNLYYEGLANLRDLKNVKWLSFNGVDQLDDWYLDRITNMFSHSVVYLDIRNCPNYTERGLGALYRMRDLKILYIDDILMTTRFEMTLLMLQEINNDLDIRIGH